MDFSRYVSMGALEIVKALNPNVLMIVRSDESNPNVYILEVLRDKSMMIKKSVYRIRSENLPPASFSLFRYLIVSAIDAGILEENDYVFAMADRSMGIEFDGLFMFFKIDEQFLKFSKKKIKEDINDKVFDTVLEIAKEIGKQGREGKKVGTAFIIGDSKNVLLRSRQMIINPFEGHPPQKRNVLDPSIKETIKNFSLLDGAFIIDNNGFIHAAGRYLNPSSMDSVNLPGLGARHQSAAAMTAETESVAIVVSESGGIVRIFRKGELVMEVDPNQEEDPLEDLINYMREYRESSEREGEAAGARQGYS